MLFDLFKGDLERISNENFGGNRVSSSDGITDEGGHFFVSKIENTLLGLSVHFFELTQEFLVKDVEADQRKASRIGDT